MKIPWNQETFAASVTGRAWTYTEHDGGWKNCCDAAELRAIFAEEMTLESIPEWAVEIVDRMLTNPLAPCGHYTFPRPILQVCEAIGQERCPDLILSCYTADPERKILMSRYIFILDAWAKRAPLEAVRAELPLRGDPDKDWNRISEAIFATLGEPTQQRLLLVRRLIHRLRWWLKTLIWTDDQRNRFGLDTYLGDVRGSGQWGNYGNIGFDDPYFTELELPAVRELAAQIRETIPNGAELLQRIESTWLCAPKTFRYLERLILEIGGVGCTSPPDLTRSILQCEETYPDFAACQTWHASFISSLDAWLDGDISAVPILGKITPAKHWLVGLLRHRLQIYEGYTQYLGGNPGGKSGDRKIDPCAKKEENRP
ncbi:MAG: hypothetical protein HOC74_08185 [Gemmatimonadetes bacterium]|jgi:hypothetical protein|nr:hypothetical protein [Gemmatimonadota bacterium]